MEFFQFSSYHLKGKAGPNTLSGKKNDPYSHRATSGPVILFAGSSAKRIFGGQTRTAFEEICPFRTEPSGGLPGAGMESLGLFGAIKGSEFVSECRFRRFFGFLVIGPCQGTVRALSPFSSQFFLAKYFLDTQAGLAYFFPHRSVWSELTKCFRSEITIFVFEMMLVKNRFIRKPRSGKLPKTSLRQKRQRRR